VIKFGIAEVEPCAYLVTTHNKRPAF